MNGGDGKSVSSFLCKAHSTIPQGVVALRRKKIVNTLLTFQCTYSLYIHRETKRPMRRRVVSESYQNLKYQ